MGVNKYRLEKEDNVDVLVIDNSKVREEQINRIEQVKKERDNARVYIRHISYVLQHTYKIKLT